MNRLFPPGYVFVDQTTAVPVAGGSVEFDISGTTTNKNVFDENDVSLGNTLTLDAEGRFATEPFGDLSSTQYRVTCKDSAGATVWGPEDKVGTLLTDFANAVGSLAELKALTPTAGQIASLNGYPYEYDASSTATADDGAVILPDSGTGRWLYQGEAITPVLYQADPTGGTDATTAINAAITYATANRKSLTDLEGGKFRIDGTLAVTTTRFVIQGNGKTTFDFFGSGQLKVGDASNNAQYFELRDVKIEQDSTGSVSPILIANSTRPRLDNIEAVFVYQDAILLGEGTTFPAGCNFRNLNIFGSADINAIRMEVPSGATGSFYITDSRLNGPSGSTKSGIRVNLNGGSIDGFGVRDTFFSDYTTGIYINHTATGSKLDNAHVTGCLIDQVNQFGVLLSTLAGSEIGDFKFHDNVVNGTVQATTTTDALFSIQGVGTFDRYVVITNNFFKSPERGCIERTSGATGGNFIISGNEFSDYPRDGNAAGYAIAYDGTLDYLEITNNRFDTNRTRDYDIRDNGATVTKLVQHSNTNIDVAPTTGKTNGKQSYNKGTATVLNTTTSIVVTHNLAATPAQGDIVVTPTESLGSAAEFWVDTLTATQFTINVDANPGTDVTFAWTADVREV